MQKFEELEFSEGAKKLIWSLDFIGSGKQHVLLLARIYGPDYERWEQYLQEEWDIYLSPTFFSFAIRKEDVQNIYDVLKENGYIKELNEEGLVEVDWLLKNFGETKAETLLERWFEFSAKTCQDPEDRVAKFNDDYDRIAAGFSEEITQTFHKYLEAVVGHEGYAEIVGEIRGRSGLIPKREDVLKKAMDKLSDEVTKKAMFRILMAELP